MVDTVVKVQRGECCFLVFNHSDSIHLSPALSWRGIQVCCPRVALRSWIFLLFSDGQITAILDQKNYVEELNRQLRFV